MDTRLIDGTRRIAERIRNANYHLIEMWKCNFDRQENCVILSNNSVTI